MPTTARLVAATVVNRETRPHPRSAAVRGGPAAEPGLFVRGTGPTHLRRPRLIRRLNANRDRRLVALVAPAGFGKTVLLTEWVASDERPVAWLTVGQRENDPAALLGLLAQAVNRLSEMGRGLVADFDADGVSAWAGTSQLVGAALARCRGPIVVVLDNAEKLTNPAAVDAVVAFAEHLPHLSQVVIAARSSVGWPISRLVAAGDAMTLGTIDLTFDADEVRSLLAHVGAREPAAAAGPLIARTEGWPVGTYLEALAHGRQGHAPDRAAATTGALRLVSEYVGTEVLAGLPPEDAEFLVRTSHLERLRAPLCDAVLERADSAEVLHRIERTCLFLTRLGGGDWYRVQPMLREVLREELQGNPSLIALQNQRAATWFEANELGDEALGCSFAARDTGRIARLLPAAIRRAFNSGRVETVRASLFEVERSRAIGLHPALAATSAIAYGMLDDAGRAERCSDIATRGANLGHDEILVGRAATARALLCRDGVVQMRDDARIAVELLPASADEAPLARTLLGVAEALTGDATAADHVLADASAGALGAGDAGWEACVALVFRAHLADTAGDRQPAEALVRRARAAMRDANLDSQPVAALVHAMEARLAMRHGATTQARADLASAERLRGSLTHAMPWAGLRARLDMAAALLALSDVAGARQQLRELRGIQWLRPDMGALDGEIDALAGQVEAIRETNLSAFMLTVAELRLLPLLATHLTFPEIGERLFLSTNTIKTEAKSIYRKLNVASRGGAVERASEIGLLETWIRLGAASTAANPEPTQ